MTEELTAQTILDFMRAKTYQPLTFGQIARALAVSGRQRRRLARILAELEADGKVVKTRAERYGLPERMNLVVGRVQAHSKGYAFVIPERDDQGDVFVAAGNLGSALHNDRVIVRVTGRAHGQRRTEGEVIRVLERANRYMVGRLDGNGAYAFVVPADARINRDVFLPPGAAGDARPGDVVVVEITAWPEGRRSPEGRVVRRLGREGERGVDVDVILFNYGLRPEFPPEVLREAENVPTEVGPDDSVGRRDLRDQTIVTIDGEDAKDLDDAISIEPGRRGRWRVGVHIADVSHYVPEDSALDREARRRGTSVYLVDRVVPMLPPQLSNGICSLHPEVDRLTLSVFMEVAADGRVLEYEFAPAVIRSQARLTYEEVDAILRGDRTLRTRRQRFVPLLEEARAVAEALWARRRARGAIDFDFPEPKVLLDREGRPVDILVRRRTPATQIIEELMILCNETVARHHARRQIPFLYRVHEPPGEEALGEYERFLALFGLRLRGRGHKVKPRDFQRVLERIEQSPEAYLISTVTLRTMERARYASENLGHFGLASGCYTHFTSPIRRYPDLVIHRITKEVLGGKRLDTERRRYLRDELPEIAQHCSWAERQAEEAERESVDLKKAEYMEGKLGEIYRGMISGVTSFGFFVQLPNLVEGLVHVSSLVDDYYHFDEARYTLVGERRGRTFRLGDEVRVQVVRVDTRQSLIDFRLVEE